MKNLLLKLMAIKTYPLKFQGESFYVRDLTVRENDECLALIQNTVTDGKLNQDLSNFGKFRNKSISYSLCDENGVKLFNEEDVAKFDCKTTEELFVAIQEAKNDRAEEVSI